MQKIIDLHGNRDKRPDNFIFPYLRHGLSPLEERMIIQNTIHTINKKMTAIGKALGYGNITTYWSRHAFTNNSLNKGRTMFSLSQALGHTTVKTTQNYAGKCSNKQIIEDANVLDTVEI
jgi:integrase